MDELENMLAVYQETGQIDHARLRQQCEVALVEHECVLAEHDRLVVWGILLGCSSRVDDGVENWVNAPDQHVIDQALATDWGPTLMHDLKRTRGYTGDETYSDRLGAVLMYYCTSRGVAYKQGLNEILAPFLLINSPESSLSSRYLCFYQLISKFLPSIYDDEMFESLQCILRLFEKLILYHDPQLCHLLDQNDLLPELYAVPWFVTLFARGLELSLLYQLWDIYIVYNDPFLHYYMALALILDTRTELFAEKEECYLPAIMGRVVDKIKDSSRLLHYLKLALQYRSRTPLPFRQELHDISFVLKEGFSEREVRIRDQHCLVIPAQDIVTQCFSDILEDGSIKYILLDIRSAAEFENGHLPCAIHFDEELIEDPERLSGVLSSLESIQGCHICLMGRGQGEAYEDDALIHYLYHFFQKGYSYMSWCEGGYTAVHDIVERTAGEMIDHDRAKCLACNPDSFAKLGKNLFNKFNNTLTQLSERKNRLQLPKFPFLDEIKYKESTLVIEVADVKNLDSWKASGMFTLFRGLEIADGTKKSVAGRRILAISDSVIVSLEPVKGVKKNQVTIVSRRRISELIRVTSKKAKKSTSDDAKFVSFYWNGASEVPEKQCYFISGGAKCVELVSRYVEALQS